MYEIERDGSVTRNRVTHFFFSSHSSFLIHLSLLLLNSIELPLLVKVEYIILINLIIYIYNKVRVRLKVQKPKKMRVTSYELRFSHKRRLPLRPVCGVSYDRDKA